MVSMKQWMKKMLARDGRENMTGFLKKTVSYDTWIKTERWKERGGRRRRQSADGETGSVRGMYQLCLRKSS